MKQTSFVFVFDFLQLCGNSDQILGVREYYDFWLKGNLCMVSNFFKIYLFIYLGHAAQLAGSQFPDQGLNPGHGTGSAKS